MEGREATKCSFDLDSSFLFFFRFDSFSIMCFLIRLLPLEIVSLYPSVFTLSETYEERC